MALDQSVLSELADALKSSDGIDLVREAVRLVFQELIESELSGAIGAGLYERTSARTNERNGHRPRVVSTKAGDVSLGIPKLRKGSFFPSILEPRRRIDQALYAVVMESYVHGVSTRAVDELVQALGIDSGISSQR
jgi:putative transposase